jgi:hypothetical protein
MLRSNPYCAVPARILLIIAFVVSLLFSPQARPAMPITAKMPGCMMMSCVSGCCVQMPCCTKSAQDRQPEQAPAPARANLEFAAPSRHTFSLLYVRPALERRLAFREDAYAAHTLPRMAATCVRLI